MLQAIERICRYTKGKNFEDFIADDMMYYAVVKNIEILGEASNMLTEEFRQAHPKDSLETSERHEELYRS